MLDITQLYSWQDINDSDILPSQVGEWEEYMEIKSLIDNTFESILKQIKNQVDVGLDYLSDIENYIALENYSAYINDHMRVCLEAYNDFFNIPNLDQILGLPQETRKVFNLLYRHFNASYVEDLLVYLFKEDFYELYKAGEFNLCKKILINYYRNIIKSMEKLLGFVSESKQVVEKKIDEYGFVLEVITASIPDNLAVFFAKLLENW